MSAQPIGRSADWLLPIDEIQRWPIVRATIEETRQLAMSCRRIARTCDDGTAGQILWSARVPFTRLIGIAFEWVEVRPGVLVIANLLSITSNVLFVRPDGTIDPSPWLPPVTAWAVSLGWPELARCSLAQGAGRAAAGGTGRVLRGPATS